MKKILAMILAMAMLLIGVVATAEELSSEEATAMMQALIDAATELDPSENLYFEDGLEISTVGIHYNSYPTEFDGCYFFLAIQSLTNVTIDNDWRVSDDYTTQIAAILASGDLPDIIQADAYGVMSLVDEGAIIALDDYLDLIPNIVEAVGEEGMSKWRQADGHIYTIPTIVNIPGSYSVMVRQDWLDALGMDVPETWDEWVELWRAIKENDCNGNGDPDDEIPLALTAGDNGEASMAALLNAFGIKCSSDCQFCILDDGTYTLVYEHPRYAEFLQAVADLYEEGLLDQEFATRTQSELYTVMDSDLVGTTMTWAERAKVSTNTLREAGNEDALWTCVSPITGPYGDQLIQSRETITNLWSITIAAEEEGKVEDILTFFNWLFSEEGINLYSYGIEGVSYEVVDGSAVLADEVVANGFVDYRIMGMQYGPFGGVWESDAYMQCLFAGSTLEELDDASYSFYEGLFVVNNDYYYSAPSTLETDAYTEYRAELITAGVCVLRDQAIAGQITVDEFFEKYEELKEQGLQEVIDEAAEAYATIVGE